MLARPRSAALASLACLAGLALTGVLAYLVPVARAHDSASLSGFVGLGDPQRDPVLWRTAHLVDPRRYAVITLALIAVALVRRRPRVAAAIAVVMVGAPLTTESLKHLLAHPRVAEWLGSAQIGAASWPSGHATAAMTSALCAVMAAPALLRPVVGVAGGLFALAVSFAILVLHWHFPSDIVGGYLCAATWALAAVALLHRFPGRRGERAHDRLPGRAAQAVAAIPAAGLGAAVLVGAAGLVLERPRALATYLSERPSFTASALAIGALAALIAAALVRATGRDG